MGYLQQYYGFLDIERRLDGLIILEHFYDAILMHIRQTGSTELTDIAKEFIGKYKNNLRNKLIETFTL